MQDHCYQKFGVNYFNFSNIYHNVVLEAKSTAHFVEVGAYYGRSTAFMAIEIINSKKNIRFDVVDTFQGTPSDIQHGKSERDIIVQFIDNMYNNDLLNHVNILKMTSLDAAMIYPPNMLDFVFIDACHEYEYVLADIKAWYPKIKVGGTIAGHDYSKYYPGTIKAVNEYFGKDVIINKTSWIKEKI